MPDKDKLNILSINYAIEKILIIQDLILMQMIFIKIRETLMQQ